MTENNLQVLVDTNAFLARIMPEDQLHMVANQLFSQLHQSGSPLVTTSAVMDETATILSHRASHEIALRFLRQMERAQFPVIYIDEDLHAAAWTCSNNKPVAESASWIA